MGKGLSQRKRAVNFVKARKESGKQSSLPPPPEEVGSKRKGRRQDDMPNSLRQMLELKAKLESQPRKRSRLAVSRPPAPVAPQLEPAHGDRPLPAEAQALPNSPQAHMAGCEERVATGAPASAPAVAEILNPDGQATEERSAGGDAAGANGGLSLVGGVVWSAARQGPNPSPSKQHAGSSLGSAPLGRNARSGPAAPSQEALLPGGQAAWRPDGGSVALHAPFVQKPGLKQRKKDFLNRRKLRKRGVDVRPAAEGDRLEKQLQQDPHRPAFGEQALAPLKVNLKRKHWGAAGEEARAGQRCAQVFQRQLAAAAAGAKAPAQGAGKKRRAQRQGAQLPTQQGGPAKPQPGGDGGGAAAEWAAAGSGTGAARGRQGRGFKTLQARRAMAAAAAEHSTLRDSVVLAYRGQRERAKGCQAGGPASARSLAALVQRKAKP